MSTAGQDAPSELTGLAPERIRLITVCPTTRSEYDYIPLQHRFILACKEHSLGIDSLQGLSLPPPAGLVPARPLPVGLLQLRGRFSEIMGFSSLTLVSPRTLTFID